MTKIIKTIIIQTDLYSGNFDSNLCGLLFGLSDDRLNAGFHVDIHHKMVTKEENEKYIFGFLETRFNEEYGDVYYSINNDLKDDYNSLEVYPSFYVYDRINDTIEFLKQKFGDEVTLYDWKMKSFKLKILGYYVKTETIESQIEKK